ncbi:NAD-dependent epimerase/dehydratase family protein [archaeon]|nr:NAD-dependent epimerase/dehydratase family protein [archaeon]
MAENKKVMVTGGLGFIGPHLVRRLLKDGYSVLVLDKSEDTTSIDVENPKLKIIKINLLADSIDKHFKGIDEVYHLAANSDVRLGAKDTKIDFDENIVVTYRVLEACRKAEVKRFIFTSSSVVYGNAKKIPTPEDYGPLFPISMYGGSKLAGEALVSTYASLYNIKATILRFANVIGPGDKPHGVIFDFITKLRKNPETLEILGNGRQNKSYIYIDDCIDGIIHAKKAQDKQTDAFNFGSKDQLDVTSLAKIVVKCMDLKDVKFTYTGGSGGWKGDVTDMMLSTAKLEKTGWISKYNSRQAVERTVKGLLDRKI